MHNTQKEFEKLEKKFNETAICWAKFGEAVKNHIVEIQRAIKIQDERIHEITEARVELVEIIKLLTDRMETWEIKNER